MLASEVSFEEIVDALLRNNSESCVALLNGPVMISFMRRMLSDGMSLEDSILPG